MSTLKRSKKEMEFSWDKERKELANHVATLESVIRDLQGQLTQRNTSLAQVNDTYGLNERIQSLTGENEFLKNRIKEVISSFSFDFLYLNILNLLLFFLFKKLEIMLDEMEQVKRFLLEVKDAYDSDRLDWQMCKEEFRYQLEMRENLWQECNLKLNELITVVSILLSLNWIHRQKSTSESDHTIFGGIIHLIIRYIYIEFRSESNFRKKKRYHASKWSFFGFLGFFFGSKLIFCLKNLYNIAFI